MTKKSTIETAREEYNTLGYKLLEEEFIDQYHPMRCICLKHPKKELKTSLKNLRAGHGCRFCANRKYRNEFMFDLESILDTKNGKIKIIEHIKKYKENSDNFIRYYKYECCVCGYIGTRRQDRILEKRDCKVCSNQITLAGFNDIHTTNPYLESLMLDKQNAYKYTQNSKDKIDWLCKDCGNIIYGRAISNVFRRGLNCDICGKYTSSTFPERIMKQVLLNFVAKVNTQIFFDWCVFNLHDKKYRGKYDFVINFNNENYIIETDGGFHTKLHSKSKYTLEDIKFIDSEKDRLAIENGYKIIRVNCSMSDFFYIKNNILSSKLNEVFDLSKINWYDCYENSLKSTVKEIWDLYNENKPIDEIEKIVAFKSRTINKYIKIGMELGKCK